MSSSALLVVFFLGIVAVIGYRFDQYQLRHNYLVDANVPCNPATEKCFASDCSPKDDLSCDTSPYKKVEIRASAAPACMEEHTCSTFECAPGTDCSVTYCSADALDSGEKCLSNDASSTTE